MLVFRYQAKSHVATNEKVGAARPVYRYLNCLRSMLKILDILIDDLKKTSTCHKVSIIKCEMSSFILK